MQLVRIVTANSLTNSFLNLHIWKFKLSNLTLGWLSEFYTTFTFMYLILAHIHLHNFNLENRIQRKINTFKKEKILFETNMKLCDMRFEKIKIWEGVASRKKVITKDWYLKFEVKVTLSINFSNTCILLKYFLISFWQP